MKASITQGELSTILACLEISEPKDTESARDWDQAFQKLEALADCTDPTDLTADVLTVQLTSSVN